MELRPAREARVAKAVSFAIPEVIIHPPEEDMDEPCISYAPNASLPGLPNPNRTKPTSALNAFLQLFTSLPELNEELPVAAKIPVVNDFVQMVRSLQCDGDEDESRVAPASVVQLDWWRDACGLPADHQPHAKHLLLSNVRDTIRPLLENVLKQTRFGKRFELGLVDTSPQRRRPKGRTDSALDVLDDDEDDDDHKHETDYTLTISLDQYGEHETIALLTLLNNHLGHARPSFYFGGAFTHRSILGANHQFQSPMASPNALPEPPRQMKFTRLPHYLLVHFHRPPCSDVSYHAPTVEIPSELDLGFYLANRQLDQPTFYRLHGFVTQTEGHFITYTRLRDGFRWFKCADEVVKEVELGSRIESKGVMLVVYRLQEKHGRR
ncbi:hypothetical protein HDU85_004319 [Gaertneriomyces sp. JEL0708]|nr:hypothetical protein HDU85_004319 [Gaertneriomyces sp. JEL0708]